jgi:hypothetical protein
MTMWRVKYLTDAELLRIAEGTRAVETIAPPLLAHQHAPTR